MSEPTAVTTSVVISAGTVTLSGSVLGMGYDVLILGAVGVLMSLRMLPPMTRGQLAVAVITTTMLAALAAPVIAAWVVATVTALAGMLDPVRWLAAVLVGGGAQLLMPAAIAFAQRRIGGAA